MKSLAIHSTNRHGEKIFVDSLQLTKVFKTISTNAVYGYCLLYGISSKTRLRNIIWNKAFFLVTGARMKNSCL